MRNRRFTMLLSAMLVLSLVAVACGGDDSSDEPAATTAAATTAAPTTTAPEPEVYEVKVAADGFLLGSQAWISMDQGYFEANNIEADVSLFGTGIEAIQGVIARQADLGHALDFAVLNLVAAADENMVIVGGVAAPLPGFHSLAVRNEITGAADLVGKKIGYVEGTSEHFVTLRHLEQNGISADEVELVPLPGLFELVGALKTDEIQAAWTWLDGTNQARDDENLTVLYNDADVLDTVAIYLIAEASWAAANQETIERVLRSYDLASDFITENTEEAAQIVADAVSGNAELFANIMPNQNYRVEFTQVMLDSLDAISVFLIERDVLEAGFDARKFMDLDAMERAVPGSVTADLG